MEMDKGDYSLTTTEKNGFSMGFEGRIGQPLVTALPLQMTVSWQVLTWSGKR